MGGNWRPKIKKGPVISTRFRVMEIQSYRNEFGFRFWISFNQPSKAGKCFPMSIGIIELHNVGFPINIRNTYGIMKDFAILGISSLLLNYRFF
jgi:hypothetical protein